MNGAAMKQPRYWMWTRRKLPPPPLFNSPITTVAAAAASVSAYNESWEEQAFAEDSAGLLGGCTWPPRSYSCSFCRREFRSAQALGGHMNVHRRDRARLKQSSSPGDEGSEQYPGQDSNLEYYTSSPNPNPNSRVSPAPRSFTNPIPVMLPSTMELKLELGAWKVIREVGSMGKRDREKDDELMTSNKRCRSTVNPSASDLQLAGRSEVLKLSPTPIEELDLELRLGDPPKVK